MDDGGIDGKYFNMDAIDFVKSISGKVRGIATSPPYNKAFRGRKPHPSDRWQSSKLMADSYESYADDMPEADYVEWQRNFIEASLDAVGGPDGDGVVLYNIGRRIKDLREDSRWNLVEGFPLRQTVIWNRGSSLNQGGKRPSILPPVYELVYIIAGDGWRLPESRLPQFRKWGDVWHIVPETDNPHPAPFPLELAVRMAKLVGGHVADPFGGSGTMALAAMVIGEPWTLNDISPEYRRMFEERAARMETEIRRMRDENRAKEREIERAAGERRRRKAERSKPAERGPMGDLFG